jgi:hypothetical protein
MKKRARTDTVHLNTRLREPLRAKLESAAKRNKVSINTEVVTRLEASFEVEEARSLRDSAQALLIQITEAVAALEGGLRGGKGYARQR